MNAYASCTLPHVQIVAAVVSCVLLCFCSAVHGSFGGLVEVYSTLRHNLEESNEHPQEASDNQRRRGEKHGPRTKQKEGDEREAAGADTSNHQWMGPGWKALFSCLYTVYCIMFMLAYLFCYISGVFVWVYRPLCTTHILNKFIQLLLILFVAIQI